MRFSNIFFPIKMLLTQRKLDFSYLPAKFIIQRPIKLINIKYNDIFFLFIEIRWSWTIHIPSRTFVIISFGTLKPAQR